LNRDQNSFFRRWLITWDTNVFDIKHLRISSSVQEVRLSFSTTSTRDFAIVSFDDFITHTSRDRRNALNFFWHVIVANLKSSSIQSANSSRNDSHKSSFNSSSHSRILFSRMWFLDSYFFFDLSTASVCSSLSVDFSLLRVEARLLLTDDDSKVICQLSEVKRFARIVCEIKSLQK
jgi:hypothetical protein